MVDLEDLVGSLQREVSPPGDDLYPDAVTTDWTGQLRDAFWQARLFGALGGYEENAAARGGPVAHDENKITPLDAELGYDTDDDLAPELQHLIVLYAGYRIVLAKMQNTNTAFEAEAGPTRYAIQKSATLLNNVLDAIKAKIDTALSNLSDYVGVDAWVGSLLQQRNDGMGNGEIWFS